MMKNQSPMIALNSPKTAHQSRPGQLHRLAQLGLLGCTAALISGCATMEQATASLNCMISRVANVDDPRCNSGAASTPTTGTAAAPAADRFVRLQEALNQETTQATARQTEAVQAMQGLPVRLRAVPGQIQTRDIAITDSQSGSTRQLRAFSALSVDMPLAAKGRREYTRAMDAIKTLANELADNRGSATISVEQSAADVTAGRVNTSSGKTESPNGSPVMVRKTTSSALPVGVERYTVEAGEIRGKL